MRSISILLRSLPSFYQVPSGAVGTRFGDQPALKYSRAGGGVSSLTRLEAHTLLQFPLTCAGMERTQLEKLNRN